MGDRRSGTATILFTDLVASTDLRSRLGDDGADELFRAQDQAWREAVLGHDGEVVKGLGDGLLAAFTGAADAVAAAVDGQQRIEVINRRDGAAAQLAVRVGVSAGDVVWEDGDCHGIPVVAAARLCDSAEGGQILCDDLVRGLARNRSEHAMVLVGERELKGLSEPVVAYQVTWSVAPAGEVAPLPGPLAPATGQFPFAGRDESRQMLDDAWKSARHDGRTVVLVSGEPGQGKTRLTAEAARAAHEEGAWVLAGRCDEQVQAPYAPWLEILRHAVAHAEEAVLRDHVERRGGDLGRLVPELGARIADLPPLRDLDPETERLAVYDAAVDLIVGLAAVAPVFLVIEDAHWADQASVALLRRMVSHLPGDAGVLVVVTYRDTDIDRVHPLSGAIGEFRRAPSIQRIALRGMDDAEVVELLTGAGGHELDEVGRAFAATLARETEGNPFFVGEVLRHLADTGVLVQQEGRWQGTVPMDEAGLPEGVREVVGQRLSSLSPEANEMLRVAAVIGREFDLGLVAAASEQGEDAVLGQAEEALASSLLDEVAGSVGRMSFSHALVRTTLLEELSTTRRVRLHARIGELLEGQVDVTAAELAYHFGEAAAAGLADKAVEHFVAAAAEADSRAAHAEAATFYDRALEAFDGPRDDPGRSLLLLGKADSTEAAGDVDTARGIALEVGAIARALGDAALLVRAGCSHVGRYSVFAQPGDPAALEMIRDGLDQIGEAETEIRSAGMAALVKAGVFDVDGAGPDVAEEATRLAREVGSDRLIVSALDSWTWAIRGSGRPDLSAELAEEMVRRSARLADDPVESGAYYKLAVALCEQGDMDRARAEMKTSTSYRAPLRGWNEDKFSASQALAAGRWTEAIRYTDSAREQGAILGATNESIWAGQRCRIALLQGKLEEARAMAEAQEATGIPASSFVALLHLAAGDVAAARQVGRGWVENATAVPPVLVRFSYTSIARVAAWTGDAELVAWLRSEVEPLAGSFLASEVSIEGAAEHVIGLTEAADGDLDAAVSHLEQAIEADRARDWHALVTEHLVDLARVLHRRGGPGDADRATVLAREAAERADDLAMPIVGRWAQDIVDHGAEAPGA